MTDLHAENNREDLPLIQQLCAWYDGRLGRLLMIHEKAELDQILPYLFGYHLLQVGGVVHRDLMNSSRISHHVVLDESGFGGVGIMSTDLKQYPDIRARAISLPIVSDCIDVVLLPHTMEYQRDPHQVLREAERILVPEGHVVIIGFNPWSLFGLWRLLRWNRRRAMPWRGVFRSVLRIKDWLALLGFDIVSTRHAFYRPPIQNEGVMKRLLFMERLGVRWWPILGGVYLIVAKKRVATVTPIRPRWRPRRALLGADVPRPSSGV